MHVWMQLHIHSLSRHLSRAICHPFLGIFDKGIDTHQREPLPSLLKLCLGSRSPTFQPEEEKQSKQLESCSPQSQGPGACCHDGCIVLLRAFAQLLLHLASLCQSLHSTSYLPGKLIHYSSLICITNVQYASCSHSLSPPWASLVSVQLTIHSIVVVIWFA